MLELRHIKLIYVSKHWFYVEKNFNKKLNIMQKSDNKNIKKEIQKPLAQLKTSTLDRPILRENQRSIFNGLKKIKITFLKRGSTV
jgi:hypothetical protein